MRRLVLLLTLAVAGCGPAPRVVPVPPPSRVVAPPPRSIAAPPPPAADWRDWPQTAGTWRYEQDARGSVAMFGTVGQDALAVLRCDRQGGRVFLSVPGAATATLGVRTTSVSRSLPAGATGATPAYVAATLAPTDPLLDAIAFSRGRFVVERPGAAPAVLPAWAEVGRVVEDCRP